MGDLGAPQRGRERERRGRKREKAEKTRTNGKTRDERKKWGTTHPHGRPEHECTTWPHWRARTKTNNKEEAESTRIYLQHKHRKGEASKQNQSQKSMATPYLRKRIQDKLAIKQLRICYQGREVGTLDSEG